MKTWEDKAGSIEAVKRLARRRIKGDAGQDFVRFIEAFFRSSAPDDVAGEEIEALFDLTRSMWEFTASRTLGVAKARVFNPDRGGDGWQLPHTVIQIANDDMPFLIDSITGGLTVTRRLAIRVMHHPLISVARDQNGKRLKTYAKHDEVVKGEGNRESCIHIELDTRQDDAALKDIQALVEQTLSDIRFAVADWELMLARVEATITSLGDYPPPVDEHEVTETQEFLLWLTEANFTLIGYREYRFRGDPLKADFRTVPGSGLGVLRDPRRRIFKGPAGLAAVTPEIREFLTLPDPVMISKANVKTRVHRPVHLDYIGVKIFDEHRRVIGERRFVGLFTSQSYGRRAASVPLLRRKVENVQRRAGFNQAGHAGKTLTHILESFPRDELFQISEDQLLDVSLGVLRLLERPRPAAFVRRDKFERFVSALVYVPRDRYHSALRNRIGDILCNAYNGHISVYYAQLSEDVLARWHFIIRTTPGELPIPDPEEIDLLIGEAAKSWGERLKEALNHRFGEAEGGRLDKKYNDLFSEAYKEAFLPHQATHDIVKLEEVRSDDDICFEIYRLLLDPADVLRLKIFHGSRLVPLSDCLPKLEHLGLKVIGEHAYELAESDGDPGGRRGTKIRGGIQDFYLENAYGGQINVELVKPLVEDILPRVWDGRIEDDGLNALSIQANFDWTSVVVLRAYAKYLRQIGLPFSQDYFEDCIARNPEIARKLLELFEIKFDPNWGEMKGRAEQVRSISRKIRTALDSVASLDQDRILRSYLRAITATIRTNFYQAEYQRAADEVGGGIALALKIESGRFEDIPRPRPFAEIFVYSPRVEGIHLRGGPIARGGLRWSDRREDFRTEVLGLAKAQQVKNAVIVPVGAKGGFVPKRLSPASDRETTMREGTACYRTFVTSLLSVTDNLKGRRVVAPAETVRWDENDPYLVVAADKGTATFSDIANGIAAERNFWLGDAFASGGSIGYDHKKMGITARGAWVSVQRHFLERGKDIQKDQIDVIGIGDMSGDVFGNGMLLSKAIRLKAAFDHRHIFFDPDPDKAASYRERRRLFKKRRSSWADYKPELISAGGGVFDRSAKTIKLSRPFRDFLGVDARELSPAEVIHHLLRARADLLWVGGIGTYIKASVERNAEVGDRTNDAVRVDASELRVRAIGEGGNLGLTQQARIEFARMGGAVNTDFIDNSAGVNCSDKEVNIKILLADAMRAGDLDEAQRQILLSQMTDDVSDIVLRDNYLQAQAISIAEAQAVREREQHHGLITVLERDGRIDRDIEALPSDDAFSELALAQKGLTRPEIATLMAHGKMALYEALIDSDLPDNDVLWPELIASSPKVLSHRFPKHFGNHQLKREIVSTNLANEVVNRAGLTFIFDVKEETGLAIEQIVSAFIVARDAFGLGVLWSAIDALDNKAPAEIQIQIHIDVARFLNHQVVWILRNMPRPIDIAALVTKFSKGLEELLKAPESLLSRLETDAFNLKVGNFRRHGVPRDLAVRIAGFEVMDAACDIVHVADALNRKVGEVGTAYFEVGHRIGFDWLRRTADMISSDDRWDQLAALSIIEDLADQQRDLTRKILASEGCGEKTATKASGLSVVKRWAEAQAPTIVRAERLLSDLKSSGTITVAKLSFAARHMRSILPSND